MSKIMAGARGFPLPGPRPFRFPAHHAAVDAADILGVADGEADLLALEARIGDRLLVQRARDHLEALLEAPRGLPQAPGAADLGRRVVEVRGAPVAAVAGGGLGHVRAP